MKRTTAEVKKNLKLVLIGNGMTGFKFCEKYIKYKLFKKYDLTVFGEENLPAYDRVNLTKFFELDSPQQLCLAPASWYSQNKINLITGDPIVEINREEGTVRSLSGRIEKYDKLIFATGSNAFVPPLGGFHLKGVFVYRTIEDLRQIKALMPTIKKAIVIGGGILGLEAARALLNAGLSVTVVEAAAYIMSRQLDQEAAKILSDSLKKLGLTIVTGAQTRQIIGGAGVEGIELDSGEIIPANMVVISAGIRARDELAKATGLEVNPRGGIVVDEYTQTSDKNIYAIGECAFSLGKIWGLAAPCFEMADILASRLANIFKAFSGNSMFSKLKILETKVAFFGDSLGENQTCFPAIYKDEQRGIYRRVNISPDGKYLLGGTLLGDISGFSALLQLYRNKTKIQGSPESLVSEASFTGLTKISDLPDTATICICEQVSKGTITDAIRSDKLTRLDQVKASTGAGTGCESCASVIEELLEEMAKV